MMIALLLSNTFAKEREREKGKRKTVNQRKSPVGYPVLGKGERGLKENYYSSFFNASANAC